MTQTTARIKKGNNHFEIMVDLEEALKFKKGGGSVASFLEFDKIYKDVKKGDLASKDEMEIAFGTSDVGQIAEEIVKRGDVLVDQAHRSAEQDQKIKQVVDFIARNAIDAQSGNPITPERIKSALEQAHVMIKNVPVDQQITEIMEKLATILPIKLDTKKIKITVPAIYTGAVYGLLQQYKESENWNDDGSLEVVVNVPAGIMIDFYEKLNGPTHGAALAEEVKEE